MGTTVPRVGVGVGVSAIEDRDDIHNINGRANNGVYRTDM